MLRLKSVLRAATGLAIAAAACVTADSAQAFSPYLVVPDPAVAEASPAYRYANMTDAQAFAELDRRQILYTRLGEVPGVRAPIRLTGRLHGVWFHSSLPPDQRVTSMFEILDARLALALDDYAVILERHDIDEVVHFTMYRPNVPRRPAHDENDEHDEAQASAPRREPTVAHAAAPSHARGAHHASPSAHRAAAAKPARSAPEKGTSRAPVKQKGRRPDEPKPVEMILADAPAHPTNAKPHAAIERHAHPAPAKPLTPSQKTTWAPPGTRHPAGLAIDVGIFHKKDGRWISVASSFHGHIGDKTCGAGAHVPEEPDARELRSLVCEAFDAGIFTYVLTPDYNAAHVDHFHMEIKPGVKWFLYH